jgi:hypothetical protein
MLCLSSTYSIFYPVELQSEMKLVLSSQQFIRKEQAVNDTKVLEWMYCIGRILLNMLAVRYMHYLRIKADVKKIRLKKKRTVESTVPSI